MADPGPGSPESEGSFLQRWSRRKAAARQAAPTPDPTPVPVAPGAAPVEAAAGQGGAVEQANDPDLPDIADRLDIANLPDIDSLGRGSDFRAFMQAGVPAELRTRALRKLWRLDPVLANLDGLVDYGEDFTDAARVVDQLQTAYRVGRGFLPDEPLEPPEPPEPREPPEAGAPEELAAAADTQADQPVVVAADDHLVVPADLVEAPHDPTGDPIGQPPAAPVPSTRARPLPKRG